MDNEIKYLKKKLFIAKMCVILAKTLFAITVVLTLSTLIFPIAGIILTVMGIVTANISYYIMALKVATITIISYSISKLIQLYAVNQLRKMEEEEE